MVDESAPPAPSTSEVTDVARRTAPWTRVLGISVAAFLVWLLLFAPTLQHNAQVSPVGARRTVAMDILGPIAATSRALHVQVAVGRRAVGPGPPGGRLGRPGPRGDRLEQGVEPAHRLVLAPDHQAVAPVQAPHAAARPAVHVVQTLC